jgi:hypothetical protein
VSWIAQKAIDALDASGEVENPRRGNTVFPVSFPSRVQCSAMSQSNTWQNGFHRRGRQERREKPEASVWPSPITVAVILGTAACAKKVKKPKNAFTTGRKAR